MVDKESIGSNSIKDDIPVNIIKFNTPSLKPQIKKVTGAVKNIHNGPVLLAPPECSR